MTYNNEFDIHQRDASVFDLEYAMQLKSMYPEVWEKSGGTYGDRAFDSLIEIMNQGGIALTPEQVEVLDLRDAWISRHAKDSSAKGVLAQVKWLAVGNLGESGMKRLIASEIDVVHFKKAKQPLKDPKGGLTAAGRRHFNRTQGSKLKPGVRGPANTPEKLRRKGSFLTRFFTNPSGPMKDEKGRPTRLALSAAAWGESVPQNAQDASELAAKGRRMLDRYQSRSKKDDHFDIQTKAEKKCPPATQDVAVNIKNRQKAIDSAGYGPLNPEEPNTKFWQKKADSWDVSVSSAKKQKCGNCILFIRTPKVLQCIETGLSDETDTAWDVIDAGKIGYCEPFDFKCHSERTCDAWVAGGPTIKENDKKVKIKSLDPIEKMNEKQFTEYLENMSDSDFEEKFSGDFEEKFLFGVGVAFGRRAIMNRRKKRKKKRF